MKPQAAHTYEDKLLEFVYGELPPAEMRSVESHVKGCAKCSAALASIQGVRRSMAALVTEPAPDAGLDSLLAYANQTARRIQAGPAARRSRWNRWVLSLAGVASLAIVGVVATRVAREHPAQSAEQVAEAVVVAKYEQEQADRRREQPPPPPPAQAQGMPAEAETGAEAPKGMKDEARNFVEGARLPSTVAPGRTSKSVKRKESAPSDYAQGTRVEPSRKMAVAKKADAYEGKSAAGEPATPVAEKRSLPLSGGMASQSRVEAQPPPEPTAAAADEDSAAIGGVVAQSTPDREPAASMPRAAPSAPSAMPSAAGSAGASRERVASAASVERQKLMKEIDGTSDRARLQGLLSRLCELEIDMGYIQPSSCVRIIREFPNTGAAALARSRLNAQRSATGDGESQPVH